MLGVSQAALRSWEDRYGMIVADRSEGGRRIYTREQVEQLRFVKERLAEGLSAADAHRLLADREAPTPSVVAEQHAPHPDARLLVLLAESDQFGAELSDASLRSEGFDVAIATSAAEAEEKFASQEPALSIVELMISGGVGRELCRRMKRRRRTPLLCVSSLDLREQALADGADAFLQKPLDPRELISTVRELLGRDGLMRANLAGADD